MMENKVEIKFEPKITSKKIDFWNRFDKSINAFRKKIKYDFEAQILNEFDKNQSDFIPCRLEIGREKIFFPIRYKKTFNKINWPNYPNLKISPFLNNVKPKLQSFLLKHNLNKLNKFELNSFGLVKESGDDLRIKKYEEAKLNQIIGWGVPFLCGALSLPEFEKNSEKFLTYVFFITYTGIVDDLLDHYSNPKEAEQLLKSHFELATKKNPKINDPLSSALIEIKENMLSYTQNNPKISDSISNWIYSWEETALGHLTEIELINKFGKTFFSFDDYFFNRLKTIGWKSSLGVFLTFLNISFPSKGPLKSAFNLIFDLLSKKLIYLNDAISFGKEFRSATGKTLETLNIWEGCNQFENFEKLPANNSVIYLCREGMSIRQSLFFLLYRHDECLTGGINELEKIMALEAYTNFSDKEKEAVVFVYHWFLNDIFWSVETLRYPELTGSLEAILKI